MEINYRQAALNYLNYAKSEISNREHKEWPAAASRKDKKKWYAEKNQYINENLAIAQVYASLIVPKPVEVANEAVNPVFNGKTLEDLLNLAKVFGGGNK